MKELLKSLHKFKAPASTIKPAPDRKQFVYFILRCLAGADDFQEIETWGNLQKAWLGNF